MEEEQAKGKAEKTKDSPESIGLPFFVWVWGLFSSSWQGIVTVSLK